MVAIYANQLTRHLKPVPSLVLLWGDDAGALRQSAQTLMDATGVDPADPFVCTPLTLDTLSTDPAALVDAACTVSLMGGKRLVWLKGVSGDESAATAKALTESVKILLERPLEGVYVILPVPKLLDKAHPLVKAMSAHPQALCVRFFADTARDVSAYLHGVFQAAGKRLSPDASAALAANLGADRDMATREAEKLMLYVGDATEIGVDDVLAVVAGLAPADMFKLAEAVGARNPRLVDQLTEHLRQQGEDLNAALMAAVRHLTRLQELQASGNPAEAARALRPPLPPQVQQELVRQARAYPPKRLAGLNAYVLASLTQARSGLVDSQLVIARALLALAA